MPVIVVFHYFTAVAPELVLLFGFGLFGFRFGQDGVTGTLLAALLVGVAIALWARFAAPRSAGWRETAPAFATLAALDLGLAMALGRI